MKKVEKETYPIGVHYFSDEDKIIAGHTIEEDEAGITNLSFKGEIYDVTLCTLKAVYLMFVNEMMKKGEETITLKYDGYPYILTMLPERSIISDDKVK